jgi:peptide-methionine (R)-S-oxide reductase
MMDAREGTGRMRRTRARSEAGPAAEIQKPDEQWREELTPQQYGVLRQAHTERAFTGEYVHHHDDGFYRCAGCGAELFRSDAKFDSGTGWPSFYEPAIAGAVELRPDSGLFMRRTEVRCRRCGGHLGHVFADGPAPTGDRYCINSCSLTFEPTAANGDRTG